MPFLNFIQLDTILLIKFAIKVKHYKKLHASNYTCRELHEPHLRKILNIINYSSISGGGGGENIKKKFFKRRDGRKKEKKVFFK